MNRTSEPSARVALFLAEAQGATGAGCRAASDGEGGAYRLEMRYRHPVSGHEQMLGLRAELRDGRPVIVLYNDSELAPR